jgi:bifunctional non-homologous end joining protein LigD
MAIKRAKQANKNGREKQHALFGSRPDHSDVPDLQKNPEDIQKHNLSALLQPFVVKYHCTKNPHYDFRLAHIGILKSWAMDVRPSFFPGNQLKATEVDDHLREHMPFEGVFPEGMPGAGVTIVWDTGMFEPLPEFADLEENLRKGSLIFKLNGKRLKGIWKLVRIKGRGYESTWQLAKELDSFALSEEEDRHLFAGEPRSILTDRTIKDVQRYWIEGKQKPEPQPTLF